jgi:hypothetical protein
MRTRTLLHRPAPVKYPARDKVTVRDAMARELGCSVPMAKKWLYDVQVNVITAAGVRSYRAADDLPGLSRFVAPIEASLIGCYNEPLTKALVLEAQSGDSGEEVSGEAYLLNPSRETALAWIRAIDKERALQLRLRSALAARHGLT